MSGRGRSGETSPKGKRATMREGKTNQTQPRGEKLHGLSSASREGGHGKWIVRVWGSSQIWHGSELRCVAYLVFPPLRSLLGHGFMVLVVVRLGTSWGPTLMKCSCIIAQLPSHHFRLHPRVWPFRLFPLSHRGLHQGRRYNRNHGYPMDHHGTLSMPTSPLTQVAHPPLHVARDLFIFWDRHDGIWTGATEMATEAQTGVM